MSGALTPGTLVYTDEYDIYSRLEEWGYDHESVCHSAGEYARDNDGDGFCEVDVNIMEGFWSLLSVQGTCRQQRYRETFRGGKSRIEDQRRHPDLNRGMEVLQTSALPLGYAATTRDTMAD